VDGPRIAEIIFDQHEGILDFVTET